MNLPIAIRSLTRRSRAMLGFAVVVIVAVILIGFYNKTTQSTAPSSPPPLAVPEGEAGKAGEVAITEEAMKLAEIELAPAQLRQVQERLEVTGEIESGGNQWAKVTPSGQGKVVRILVNVGADVRAGQVLALLESAQLNEAQVAYRLATGRVALYEKQLGRQRELANLGEFGSSELEESRTKALDAEKDIQSARRSLAQEETALVGAKSSLLGLQSEVTKARAELDVKRSHLARAEALPQLVALQQLERLRADARQAEADLATAQARVTEGKAQVVTAQRSLQVAKSEQPLAQRQLQVRKDSLAREERVYSGGYSRSGELAEAESNLEMAQLAVEEAAANIGLLGGSPGADSQIMLLSPISGRVQEASLTLGESIGVDHVAFTVINLDHVWARLAVAPGDLAKVKVGNSVEFMSDSSPGKVLKGQVVGVGAAADEVTRTVPIRAAIQTADPSLRAGAFTKATIITDVRHERLTVPDQALQEHDGRATLYVAKPGGSGVFEVRHVTLGERGEDWREIAEGIKTGETLATGGTFYLKSEAMKNSLSDGCCSVGGE